MYLISSNGFRVNMVPRAFIFAGILVFTPVATLKLANAAGAGTAMPTTSATSTMGGSGQGQAAYPSTMAESPPTVVNQQPNNQAVPSVVAPSGTTVSLDNNAPNMQQPSSASGINIPSPPPATAFSNDPNVLAAQAEQAAIQAQAQADADEHKREQDHNIKSYDKAATGLIPLSPDQVRDFMHKLEQTQNAAQAPYAGTPNGQTRIATLSLDPGVQPPQINLASGYVTTITMVDASGEPWPILDVGVGGNFEVSPTQAGTHVVRVMPLTRVGTGDLSVLLKDLPTPVIFRLAAGGPNVDLRYDARIGKLGPGAKPPIISNPRLEAGDETLTLILENAPPNGAVRMKVGGLDARTKAWSVADKVYVRTPLTLLSPAWNSSVASADGTTVYEIGDAPVLLMSDNGAVVRAQISRDDDHDK